jgi:hypothetical protein
MKAKLIVAALLVVWCTQATATETCVRFHSRQGTHEVKGRGGVFPWAVGLERIGCDILGRWVLPGGNEVVELESYDMDCRHVQVRVRQFRTENPSKLVTPDAIGIVMQNPTRTEYSGLLRGPSGADVRVGFVRTQGASSEYYMWHDLPSTGGCRNIVIETLRPL